MSEHDDAVFSKQPARKIQPDRGSTSDASKGQVLTDVAANKDAHHAVMSSTREAEELSGLSLPMPAPVSQEEMKQQQNARAANKMDNDCGARFLNCALKLSSWDSYCSSEISAGSSWSEIEPETISMKVLIVGDAGCGKTSIIRRYAKRKFSAECVGTIDADFMEKVIPYDAHATISLQLWDLAGQDQSINLSPEYVCGARGAVIVCDLTQANIVDAVMKWKNAIDTCCKDLNGGVELPVVVIANKSDLSVGAQDLGVKMQECIDTNHIVEWFRASAKRGQRITEAFQCLLDQMVDDFRIGKEVDQHK